MGEPPSKKRGLSNHNMDEQKTELDRTALGPPEIQPEDIQYDPQTDVIGAGSYGTVYRGRCRGQEVAVKVPKKQTLSPQEMQTFQNEIVLMSNNSHPNIIILMGACMQQDKLQIVTEMCKTDLERLIYERRELSLFARMKLCLDAAAGVNWLHEIIQVVHRDLKPANLLIDFRGQVKVSDFGLSQLKPQEGIMQTDSPKGSLVWMAPEVVFRRPYSDKVDVYSFGIILWEVTTRERPFQHLHTHREFIEAVLCAHQRPPIPADIPESLKNLMSSCWDYDPNKRPSFREILLKLSEVMVDCLIEFPAAGAFWKKHFLYPLKKLVENVEWQDFKVCLCSELNIDEAAADSQKFFDHLQSLLLTNVEDLGQKMYVTMQRFDIVSKWFGRFYDPTVGLSIISEINKLMGQDWFHGDLPYEAANSRLGRQPDGTFLIRLSSRDPKNAPFSLSLPKDYHYRIERVEGGLALLEHTFRDIYELREAYRSTYMITPCPKLYSQAYVQAQRSADSSGRIRNSNYDSNGSFTSTEGTPRSAGGFAQAYIGPHDVGGSTGSENNSSSAESNTMS